MEMLLDVPLMEKVYHPATYTDSLIPVFANMLKGSKRILDPFGGVGKIFHVQTWLPNVEIEAVEIQPKWAHRHRKITIGNALDLPWSDDYFDAICTSPTYDLSAESQRTLVVG